ncbi:MAG TPA: alpha/beta fold hydrolase [Candidatus Angelobacter sp.]|nr:alpha/beta fold hydrolase [Candidatus Angelobacter sp.]
MATATTTTIPKKRSRRYLKLLGVLVLLVVALAGLFFTRPLLVTAAVQQARMWIRGIHRQNVQLGSYRIHYLVAGEGRPLVLVHGLGGSAENWLTMIPQFTAKGFRIYALDLLGYGRSDKPDVDYSISMQSDLLLQFLDSQGLQQPDIAGWSMGGWVAGKFAVDHPQRVRRVMLLDSAGLKYDAVNARFLRPKTSEELTQMMAILTPHPQPIPAFFAHDILRAMKEEDWVVGRSLQSMQTGKDILDGKLQSVKAPVLIVWGKQDVLTPLSIGEAMHKEMPQSVLYVVDGCGHLAPTECQDRIMPEMQKFLTE